MSLKISTAVRDLVTNSYTVWCPGTHLVKNHGSLHLYVHNQRVPVKKKGVLNAKYMLGPFTNCNQMVTII